MRVELELREYANSRIYKIINDFRGSHTGITVDEQNELVKKLVDEIENICLKLKVDTNWSPNPDTNWSPNPDLIGQDWYKKLTVDRNRMFLYDPNNAPKYSTGDVPNPGIMISSETSK